ncbi:hypothetical protein ElyMa_001401100 [Elysia marginata]|uniref:Uncharacterized protein n=1 Tax=Elysia marginata TaxID=1093978 RepID=A0AAV4IVB8_9GAST|nr:hypothetical protein ElyMa_001401100 [Elysia marginata]
MHENKHTAKSPNVLSRLLHSLVSKNWFSTPCPSCGRLSIFINCACIKQPVFASTDWYDTWGKVYSLHNAVDGNFLSPVEISTNTAVLRPELSTPLATSTADIRRKRKTPSPQYSPQRRESHTNDLCSCYVCAMYKVKAKWTLKQTQSLTVLTPCAACGSSVLCPCRERFCDLKVKQLIPVLSGRRQDSKVRSATNKVDNCWVVSMLEKYTNLREFTTLHVHYKNQNPLYPRPSSCSLAVYDAFGPKLGGNTNSKHPNSKMIFSHLLLSRIYIAVVELNLTYHQQSLWIPVSEIFCLGRYDWRSSAECSRPVTCPCVNRLLRRRWIFCDLSSSLGKKTQCPRCGVNVSSTVEPSRRSVSRRGPVVNVAVAPCRNGEPCLCSGNHDTSDLNISIERGGRAGTVTRLNPFSQVSW